MSHVQLSISALERLAARRTFPLHTRTGACRSLFGPVDHDELHRDMRDKLREIADMDRQRWNFNFEANSPLEGDYEWEEIPRDETPIFYQDALHGAKARLVVTPVKVKPTSDPNLPQNPSLDSVEVAAGCEERLSGLDSGSGARCPVGANQENRTDKLNSGTGRRLLRCVRDRRSATTGTSTSHITDFFSVKRRGTIETRSGGSARLLSKSPTPRKRIR